jgi:SAM-dependent methyltransferase
VMHWTEMSAGWHANYEHGRPGYAPAVAGVAGLPASAAVLELGPGTGKLTRLLVDEFVDVIAVEPDPDMRRWFVELCPRSMLVGGTAEQIPLAEASVDGVFVAEAFHWFSHDRALVEIGRVLRPPGILVLMWNRPAGVIEPSIPDVEQLLEPYWPKDIDMPLDLDPRRVPYARDWRRAFAGSGFEPLQETQFANRHAVDRGGLVAFFGSMGWISALADEERRSLLDGVRSRLSADEYRLPFVTHVDATRLAGRAG